ncbi:MAG: hypothetical protein AABZ67_16620 [Pseudomonadota bacterium]
MAESIVNEASVTITESDLIALHPRLWKAQSLCRMLDSYASEYTPKDADQLREDIQNAGGIIQILIEQTHDAINALEARAMHSMRKEVGHA